MNINGHAVTAPPILLTIAGFDPSCGAGVAADLKTFAAFGCYGVAAITSMTVQNTQGVESVHNTSSAELRGQLEVLAKDCEIAAVKIGMLGNRGNAATVGEFLDAHKFAHIVHDPVMKSSSGTELLDAGGVKYLAAELLRRSSVITPNVPEAEILSGLEIKDVAGMEAAAGGGGGGGGAAGGGGLGGAGVRCGCWRFSFTSIFRLIYSTFYMLS